MIFFIIFSTTALINHCCSNCCCECCKYSAIEENNDEKNQKEYFIPSRYFNKSTLDERSEIKDPIGSRKLKIDNNKFIDFTNPDERPITSSELFVDSGIHYKTPLNIEWANNNCAVLSVVRLLISEKNFIDRLLNKKLVDPSKLKNKRRAGLVERIFNSRPISEILDKTSNLFKSILNGEKGSYGDFLDWIEDDTEDPKELFPNFQNIYFYDYFDNYIDKIETRIKADNLKKNSINDIYCLKRTAKECYTGKYVYLEFFFKHCKIILDEDIGIVQSSGETKYYELIGSTWLCGNVTDPTTSNADHVCIVPVFDKIKNKLGYVKYQFNNVSDVKPLTYWNNVDKFDGWKDPRPVLAIYRQKDEALND